LTGLTPDKEYVFSIFSRGFEAGGRASLFTAADGGGKNIISQNEYGEDNGQIVRYKYIADPNGNFSIKLKPQDAGWHWYAFSNEERDFLSPTNIIASQGEFTNKIEINWDGFSGADYFVYRSTNDAPESSIDISGRLQSTNFVDTTAELEIIYYYRIKTAIGDDKSDYSDSATGWLQIPEPVSIYYLSFIILLFINRKYN